VITHALNTVFTSLYYVATLVERWWTGRLKASLQKNEETSGIIKYPNRRTGYSENLMFFRPDLEWSPEAPIPKRVGLLVGLTERQVGEKKLFDLILFPYWQGVVVSFETR